MKITGTLTPDDYAAVRRFSWLPGVIMLILFFPFGLLLPWRYPLSLAAILYSIAYAVLLVSCIRTWRSGSRRALQFPELDTPREFDITPERLIVTGPGSFNAEWRDRFSGYRANPERIILKEHFGGLESSPAAGSPISNTPNSNPCSAPPSNPAFCPD